MTAASGVPGWLQPLTTKLADASATQAVVQLRPGQGGRRAAVLALLAGGSLAEGSIVIVERAHTLRHHPGQLALPGGAVDDTDGGLVATALRECEEETGLPPAAVQVLGMLPAAHVAVSGFDVSTVVGWQRRPARLAVQDDREVAQVITAPLPELLDPQRRVMVQHRTGYLGPGFWLRDPTGEELLVWGLTAHLLDGIFDLAGWTREWDRSEPIGIPERFLQDARAREATGGDDLH